jgi:hypothetical protein
MTITLITSTSHTISTGWPGLRVCRRITGIEISSILVYGEVWAWEIEGGGGFS